MEELKKKMEAVLFSVGRYISEEEIAKICNRGAEEVKKSLVELKVDYETEKDSSLIVLNDGKMWKLGTRTEYDNVVRKIVSETELSKSQLETLAVIAFKYPIKQSDLIRIRTNKAYDHLAELEAAGFITRQKYGRTRLIKLTDKFFEYFDLPRDRLKERFKGFEQLAEKIEGKEQEIEEAKEEQRKAAEETKIEEEKEKKIMDGEAEIDLVDEEGNKEGLEVFEEHEEEAKVEEVTDKLGELEVVDEEPLQEAKEEGEEKIVENEKSVDEVLGINEGPREDISESDESIGEGDNAADEKKENEEEEPEHEDNIREEENKDEMKEENADEETVEKDNGDEGVDLLEAESDDSKEK